MQNGYALRACRASASPVFPFELGGIQKAADAGAEKRYPTSTAANLQPGKWCS
jgi:hypothetical protein